MQHLHNNKRQRNYLCLPLCNEYEYFLFDLFIYVSTFISVIYIIGFLNGNACEQDEKNW
jgi:hypothetical protein